MEAKLDQAWYEMDANGDGLVDYDEFCVWWDTQEGVVDNGLGWPFSSDLDEISIYGFELYEQ
eukprot:COSAG06_NODE_8_length_37897_cov_42.611884_38_plen_62_part_00